MNFTLMAKKIFIIIAILNTTLLFAQKYPFPRNITYKHGYMSKKISHLDVLSEVETWKINFVKDCGQSELRVVDSYTGRAVTLSEGIGYGMLITAYIGDKDSFDKLLNYYSARLNSHGFMNWQYVGCDSGNNNQNGAADGDLDIAMALVVATKQWPDNKKYKTTAGNLLDSIEKHYFANCNGLWVLKPGDYFGGCTCTNPSYFSPAYYRVFARFKEQGGNKTAASFWNKVANDCYVTLLKNADKNTGLVYAWTNADGGKPSDCDYKVSGSGAYNTYQYDACRTPWRIAMDYLWWGNSQAENWLKKINFFVNSTVAAHYGQDTVLWYGAGGIKNVVDGYYMNGLRRTDSGVGKWHSIPFVGAFALSAMASGQTETDKCMTELASMKGLLYFDASLGVLYKLLATGNFWNPME